MIAVTYQNPPAAEQVPLYLIEQIDKPSVYSILRTSTLFGSFTRADIDSLAACSRVVRVQRGCTIWMKGSDVDYFGIAANGFVKMIKGTSDGNEVTMELFGPGQTFGLCGTICAMGCPLSAVAVTDLWYLRVPKRAFMEIYARNIALKDMLVQRLTMRLQSAFNLMAHMASGRVDQRIAAILFMLSESYGVRQGTKLLLRVPLTRQEISEMAGTTVESTIRTLSRWQKEGLVATDRHYITILDEAALKGLVGQ
jgi:CRP-like cAMP-binding protein